MLGTWDSRRPVGAGPRVRFACDTVTNSPLRPILWGPWTPRSVYAGIDVLRAAPGAVTIDVL